MRELLKWLIPATVALALAVAVVAQEAKTEKTEEPAPAAEPAPAVEPAPEPAPAEEEKETAKPQAAEETPESVEPTTGPATTAPVEGAAPAAAAPVEGVAAEEEVPKGVNPQDFAEGQAILAERFCEFSQATARESNFDPLMMAQAAALLKASTKLYPYDGRFWRLLIEASDQIGDQDGALEALKGYRRIAPRDLVAQTQLIELYAGRIEKADDELNYLRSLLAREGEAALPGQVRSHVALMLAQRLSERGEGKAASEMLDESIKANPVNVAALDMKYQFVAADPEADMTKRAAALLACLKANPIRPAVVADMGRLLADAGLVKDSIDWMQKAIAMAPTVPGSDPQLYHDLFIDYLAELYIAGSIQAARANIDQLLKANADDVDARLLQLVIERGTADKEGYGRICQAMAETLNKRWAAVAKRAAGDDDPETAQPAAPAADGAAAAPADAAATAPADYATVAEQVKAAGDPALESDFVSALADLAWFEIYFNEQPDAAAKPIDALAALLPEESQTLRRLRGWHQMSTRQADQAHETLSGLEASDALAALAMLQLDAPDAGDAEAQKASDEQARKLLRQYPSGLVGAMVLQAMKARDLKPEPTPDAAAVRAELAKFPRGWLDIATNPQRFYSLRVDPIRVAHRYGEPIYAVLKLQNLSNQDITIGDNGIIKPGVWFEADVQAMKVNHFDGVAFETIGSTSVLPARTSVAQYVRVDQGNLAIFLNERPTPRYQVTGFCSTNPGWQGKGFVAGPGGARVPFSRKITRVGTTLGGGDPKELEKHLRKIFEEIELGKPDMKMRNLSLLGTFVRAVANVNPEHQAAAVQQAADFLEHIMEAAEDPVPSVAQWARFEMARSGGPALRRGAIESLLADKRWESRLLGVFALPALPKESQMELLGKLVELEQEPCVKEYASKALELRNRQPAEPPATQPADGDPPDAPPVSETLPDAAPEPVSTTPVQPEALPESK